MRETLPALLLLAASPASANSGLFESSARISVSSTSESVKAAVRADAEAEAAERQRRAKERPPPAGQAPAAPSPRPCQDSRQCDPGQACVEGTCASAPPPPPVSARRRAMEHFLRDRSAQLQEDLALGSGPVVDVLAAGSAVPTRALGRLLRRHQVELGALAKGEAGRTWPGPFLDRVEALVAAELGPGPLQASRD